MLFWFGNFLWVIAVYIDDSLDTICIKVYK